MEALVYLLVVSILFLLLVGVYIFSKINTTPLDRIKDLSSVFPITAVENGVIVNGRGDLTIGFKVEMPDVFSISEEDADKVHSSFISLIKLLPEGAIFHKQDFFILDKGNEKKQGKTIIEQENLYINYGRPKLNSRSNIYLTVCNRIRYDKGNSTDLQRSPNFLFKEPTWLKDYEKRMEDFRKLGETFDNALNGITGVSAKKMNDEELLEEIFRYVNVNYDGKLEKEEQESYRVNPMEIDDNGNLKIGSKLVKVLTLAEEAIQLVNHGYPKTAPASSYGNGVAYSNTIKSKTSFVFPLACGLPIDHVLNTTIQVTDNDKMVANLQGGNKLLSFLGNFYPPANVKQRVVNDFIETILNKNFQTCKTGVNIVVVESDVAKLEKSVSGAEVAFINMDRSKCYVENFDAANIFFSMIPGNAETNYREFINTTSQAVCYINKEKMVKGDVNGITFTDRYGSHVVVDMWNNKNAVNRNKVILGPSGSGKSFFINELISQTLGLGNHVIVIDIGHSYKRNVEFNSGKYYDSDDKKSLSFNLFDCNRSEEGLYVYEDTEDDEAKDDKVNFIMTILLTIIKGEGEVTPIERSLFKESIAMYYDKVNKNISEKVKDSASLKGYHAFLIEFEESLKREHKRVFKASDIQMILKPFVKGAYENLLNSERVLDIENDRFVVFDMEAVQKDETIFPIMVVIIIEMVIQKINKLKGVRKTLIIDEGLNFLLDPKMGSFTGYLYRTFRKKEGEVILAAQNVLFLDAAPAVVRDSIVLNSATNILLDHSEHTSNYKEIQRVLSFTNHQIELLDSVEKGETYREFFMKIGKQSNIYRMEVSPFANAVYTSKESEVKEIGEIAVKTGSLESAIHQYIENKKE